MYFINRLGFKRLESLLGLTVILVVAVVVVPVMRRNIQVEEFTRGGMGAELIARAALDFNTETGHWPQAADGTADLSLLAVSRPVSRSGLDAGTLVGSMVSRTAPTASAHLAEVPLDPWQRPYRVIMLPEKNQVGAGALREDQQTIVVLSAGENGQWETGRGLFDQIHQAGLPMETEGYFTGDDLGYVVTRQKVGLAP